jgi:8-oxo-dGTP pyrophosphatase MutT (NUDIX family)
MWWEFLIKANANPTHAGGVVYREENGLKEYLLVTAKRFSFMWVLPKGHIEAGESEEKTALREVKEESGMEASICYKIGNSKRLKWNFSVQVVAFYLMKFASVYQINKENREIIWLPREQAIRKLYRRDQKKILQQVNV